MIRAVIFDLFETLITEGTRTYPQSKSAAQQLGIDEQSFKDGWRRIQKDRMTGVVPDYSSAIIEICASLGCMVDYSLIQQLESDRIARFAKIFANPNPDILEALKEIKRQNMKIGLITNTSADEVTAWQNCQIYNLIDVNVLSCDEGLMKPDPNIYLTACERLEIKPSECIYIGDGSFGELSGAAELGMTTYRAAWFFDRWPDGAPDGDSISDRLYPKLPTISSLITEIEKVVNQPRD